MFGSVTKRMMNLSNPLPASSHPPANPHPPAVLRTAVQGGDSERSIGIGIRKLGKTIKKCRYDKLNFCYQNVFICQTRFIIKFI